MIHKAKITKILSAPLTKHKMWFVDVECEFNGKTFKRTVVENTKL